MEQQQPWVPSGPLQGPQQPKTYSKKFHNRFSKAHHIHGYSYSIGKGKYQTDRASKLWAQTPGNQVISSTWKQRGKVTQTVRIHLKQDFLLAQLRIPSIISSVENSRLPPRTNPLVAMAEVERPVIVVTTVAMRTIRQERAVKENTGHI